MYAFESNGSRKPLHAIIISTLIGAFLLFFIGGAEGVPLPYLFQAAAFILMTVVVYLLARYALKLYRYEITPSGITDELGEEQYDLTITEIVGKRRTVVSRVGLRDVDREHVTVIKRADKANAKAQKEALCQGKTVFRYENTPISPASCYIPLLNEKAVIVIPVDEKMLAILRQN